MAKLKGFDDDSFDEEPYEPLALNRDVARGKALHMGDVHSLVDALDDLGFYDMGRQGKPPLAQESLFKAIEDFQERNDLKVDGVIKSDGPTLERLNQVRSGPTSRRESDRLDVLGITPTERQQPKRQVDLRFTAFRSRPDSATAQPAEASGRSCRGTEGRPGNSSGPARYARHQSP